MITAGAGGARVYQLHKIVTTLGRRADTLTVQETVQVYVECVSFVETGVNDAPAPADIVATEPDEMKGKRALLASLIPFLWQSPEHGGKGMTTTGLVVLLTLDSWRGSPP